MRLKQGVPFGASTAPVTTVGYAPFMTFVPPAVNALVRPPFVHVPA